jgi:Zn-dependent protease
MLIQVVALLIAFTVHEFSHARAALAAGDDTAQKAGRITLNPIAHLDPIGTIMFLFMIYNGVGIGWGKPVPINPYRFKNPRWDNLKVSLWGPLSNLILAAAFSVIYHLPFMGNTPESFIFFIEECISINVCLAVFNMIPIPPLDGSHILASLLPVEAARKFEWAVGTYGIIILVALLFTGTLDRLISPPIGLLYNFLTQGAF